MMLMHAASNAVAGFEVQYGIVMLGFSIFNLVCVQGTPVKSGMPPLPPSSGKKRKAQ